MFWRRMEKISWTDLVRNEEVLQRVKEGRNIEMKKCYKESRRGGISYKQ
jgi:hypothetical protein